MAGVRRIYGATGLTGGATGSLDDIASSVLKPGDLAIAQANTIESPANAGHEDQFDTVYFYRYANVSVAEDVPKVITPDDVGGGSGRWLLISPAYFMEDLVVYEGLGGDVEKKIVVNKIQSNTTDLKFAYNDGTIYLTIGDDLVTIDAPVLVNGQVTSSLPTGTAPFAINSTTLVSNLNAELHGGQPITNVSVLDDNTYKYSAIPRVTNPVTIYPALPEDFVTIQWVNDQLAGAGSIDHSGLEKLVWTDEPTNTIVADDHEQYIRVDGVRPFDTTSTYPKIDNAANLPAADTHLTTKKYVDDEIFDKATDVHIRKDATVAFITNTPRVADHLTQLVTQNFHLATKYYVDTVALAGGDHGGLLGLSDDDHNAVYPNLNGLNPFTGKIGCTLSTVDGDPGATLTTKDWVFGHINTITDNFIIQNGTLPFNGLPQVVVSPLTFSTPINDGSGTYPIGITLDVATTVADFGNNALLVDIIADGGGNVTSATLGSVSGTGYRVGDVITISGAGNGLATVTLGSGDPDITPVSPWHITTKEYVDSLITGGGVTHDSTTGVGTSTAHDEYVQRDATGSTFTGLVEGINAPTLDADLVGQPQALVTKSWVRTELTAAVGVNVIPHASLVGLGNDEHPLYIKHDGTRAFSGQPFAANNAVTPNFYPNELWDFTTVEYVDNGIATLGTIELVEYVDIFGRHSFVSNQAADFNYSQDPFIERPRNELVTKDYVDFYMAGTILSTTDRWFDLFADKIETDDSFGTTTIYDGTDTGVIVETTGENLNGIGRAVINDSGEGFFVFDVTDGGWPQTFTGCYDVNGNSGITITETNFEVLADAAPFTDSSMRLERVLGDVLYMKIGGTTAITSTDSGDGWYTFSVTGDAPAGGYAVWRVFVTGTTITAIENVSVDAEYSYANTVTDIAGINGVVELIPFVIGEVTKVEIEDNVFGEGYLQGNYNFITDSGSFTNTGFGTTGSGMTIDTGVTAGGVLIDGNVTINVAGTGYFTGQSLNVTGAGGSGAVIAIRDVVAGVVEVSNGGSGYSDSTSSSTSLYGSLDMDYINPVNEKLKLSHYNPDTSVVDELPDYATGYIRTSGQVISTLTFDEWGHITGITEAGTGGQAWSHHLESVDGATITAVGDNSYWVHPDTGAVTVDLPQNPVSGTVIVIDDYRGNSSTWNITVTPFLGDRMEGIVDDTVIIDVNGSVVGFTFLTDANDTTFGWRYKVL